MSRKLKQLNQVPNKHPLISLLLATLLAVLLVGALVFYVPFPPCSVSTSTVNLSDEPEHTRSDVWDRLSVADVVEDVRDAVVHIEKVGECQGSGCLISPDGIIFTAKHVTDGQYGDYKITLDDGTEHKVKYVYEDLDNDVAFMKLDLPKGHKPLPYVKLADYDLMRVGDPLLIYGSPLGKDNFNTVSQGILSAAQRDLVEVSNGAKVCMDYDWYVLFQSNSAAYPGNSGGPVFNLNGDVIGVLVAGMDSHLNYSVPVARFRDTIDTVLLGFALQRFSPVTEESSRLAELEERVYMNEIGVEICFELLSDLCTEDQLWEACWEVIRRHPDLFIYDIPAYDILLNIGEENEEEAPISKSLEDNVDYHSGVGQYRLSVPK